jgi:Flp pilus assembly protein TadG
LALVLPFLAAILLGTFELGRAIIVKEVLSNAARKGCRTGISPGKDDTAVNADVTAVLTSHNLNAAQATIVTKVNDANVDVKTAQTGDKISVTVSIPYSSTSWLGNVFLTNQSIGSETLSMMRQ